MANDDLLPPNYDECTLELHAAEGGGYITTVTLADGRSFAGEQPAQLDAESLTQFVSLSSDPFNYGQLLFDTFLAGKPKEGLASARSAAQQAQKSLRLRLDIPADARTLHTLTWEWLYDGSMDAPFAAAPGMALSRFLRVNAPIGQPVETQPLKILVVISNPANLATFNLAPLDPAVERQKFEEILAKVRDQVDCTFLDGPATLENIRDHLEQGHFHVLHVLGHGYFKQKGYLVLEDANRQVNIVDEGSFDDLFLGQHDVRLVVLAACLSAARSQTNAFLGLGPSLVNKGVPAVVAMQRRIDIAAAQLFTQQFYGHLSRFGIVDAAVNAARYRLYLDPNRKEAGDWGGPVVFMRVEKGELFFPAPVDLGARLPPALRDRFVPVLREFVDRDPQFLMFQKIVNRQEEERILYPFGPQGIGKSWLIDRCAAWCSEQGLAWSEVDFADPKPWDYLQALHDLTPTLGVSPASFADFQTLVSQAVAAGKEHIADPETRRAVTAAFVQALARLGPTTRVMLFLDSLNQAPASIHDWLWNDLLPAFRDKNLSLGHITVTVADRAGPALDPDARWYHILAATELETLTREHFIEYARRRGFRQLEETVLGLIYDTIVATLATSAGGVSSPGGPTPYRLSLALDNLAMALHR
ncbi:MAG: CHAT domain-containing protein [Chloroflexi bacterium]|nr:CHAT domain-containing protein [Chloroflexota bacterium]